MNVLYDAAHSISACTLIPRKSKPYVDFIVQRHGIYARPVRTPRDGRDRAPELVHTHGLLRALVAPLPHANRAVVTAGVATSDELDAIAACESSVEGINETTVIVEFNGALDRSNESLLRVFGAGDPGRVSLLRVNPSVEALRLHMIQRGERN